MSSKMAAMDGESIRVTRSVSIPRSEIELRFSRSSGPGGQHAQKTESRVEAIFDVEASSALTEPAEEPRARPRGRSCAPSRRTSGASGGTASSPTERLVEQLRQALRVERARRATKPTRESQERRLEQKRRRGEIKRLRRSP